MNYQTINSIMSGIVIVICLIWIYALWFVDGMMYIEKTQKIILTGVLVIYMIFRAWRLYSSLKHRNLQKK